MLRKMGLTILIFAVFFSAFFILTSSVSKTAEKEELDNLQKAVKKATLQCYAVEGRFPSSVEYLQSNYGLQIDEDKYAVFYQGFASNVMPDITVVKL